MFKVYIYVRRFITCSRYKSFKQQIKFSGVNRSDPKAKANRGVSCRSSSLAKNSLFTGKAYNVINRKEIGCIIHFLNKAKFVVNIINYQLRYFAAIIFFGALPG